MDSENSTVMCIVIDPVVMQSMQLGEALLSHPQDARHATAQEDLPSQGTYAPPRSDSDSPSAGAQQTPRPTKPLMQTSSTHGSTPPIR